MRNYTPRQNMLRIFRFRASNFVCPKTQSLRCSSSSPKSFLNFSGTPVGVIAIFCKNTRNFVSKGMCCDFAVHDKGDGNPHTHIMLTMRAIDENGKWLPKCRKVYDLDEHGNKIGSHREDIVDWNKKENAEIWRHAWQELISLVDEGKVGTVIVKDMSRIGRNYLEVGMYTEVKFPNNDIRFIAINNGVDSDNQQDNDFTPFLNVINEFYVKDTSKKIRAVKKNKGESGEYLTSTPPYGYLKDPEKSEKALDY